VIQDFYLFRVPTDLEDLLRVLIAILSDCVPKILVFIRSRLTLHEFISYSFSDKYVDLESNIYFGSPDRSFGLLPKFWRHFLLWLILLMPGFSGSLFYEYDG